MAIAPLQQRHHDRPQVDPLLGQAVLEARGALLVGHAHEDALVDEAAQAVGEDVARDAEVALEVVEAPHAHERLAHDEDRPAVAEHLEGAGDRAVLVFVGTGQHGLGPSPRGRSLNRPTGPV
jgi:hypothetical protein